MKQINIITINTWKCDGDYRLRMKLLARQLTDLQPQIIACQECFSCETADTLHFLAESLNMNYSFVPGRFKSRNFEGTLTDSHSGLGILSTLPMKDLPATSLPGSPLDEDRNVQQVVVTISPGITMLFTNTHLTRLNDPSLRNSQCDALVKLVNLNHSHFYHILCVDFNAEEDSDEVIKFMTNTRSIDCYATANRELQGYSLVDPFLQGKKVRIDYIFSIPAKSSPELIGSEIILNINDQSSGRFPSDHFGIQTTLRLN